MKSFFSKIIFIAQFILLILFFSAFFFIACKSNKKKAIFHDKSINLKTSFNDLFLDSSYIETFILHQDSLKKYHDNFMDFYAQRNFEFAWFDAKGMTEQAHNFYNLQNDLMVNLSDSTIYNSELEKLYEKLLNNNESKQNLKDSSEINKAELLFTGQFFRYATKVYHGSELDIAQLGWFIPRKKINIIKLLDSLVDGDENQTAKQEPLNIQYRLLEKALSNYKQLKRHFEWDSIPSDKSFKLGDSNIVISKIKKRLYNLGDYKGIDSSNIFNYTMLLAVKKFQNRFGLLETGKITTSTYKHLNLTLEILITKILINMERARWMPYDTTAIDRIVVNIPEYKLRVYDSGKYSFSMPVVVGTEANNTVIFSGNLLYIVFSPYWNVPLSITKKELMPAMERNSNYLKKHDMEIVKYNGQIPEIRQRPGVNNALGGVKFLFPNKYNIYLHDTPNKEVFFNSTRSFSHGCIRIGNPKGLAKFLFRRQPLFTTDSIKALMNQPKEIWIDVKPHVKIIIKYFTAWVDTDGQLNFREDIYGYDKKMTEKLIEVVPNLINSDLHNFKFGANMLNQ